MSKVWLLAALLALPALAQDADDPLARQAATRALREGEPGADELLRQLSVARGERDRAVFRPAGGASRTALTVPQGVWLNLGPTRAETEWNSVSYQAVDAGRVRSVVPHPLDPGILYLATAGGGVWKTFDAGAHWEPLTDYAGALATGALALDPRHPDTLYLGFGDPFDTAFPGLLSSQNGGVTWSSPVAAVAHYGSAAATATSVRDIKVSPSGSARVLVATNVGLFSWDGAGTPTQIALPDAKGSTAAPFEAWSIAALGGGVWLVTGRETAINGATVTPPALGHLWRSTDDAATFTRVDGELPAADVTDLGRMTLAAAESTTFDPATARVFLLAANATDSAAQQKDLYRSDDGGQTFVALGVNASHRPLNPNEDQNDLNVMHDQAWYNQALAVDPDDPDLVFLGGNLNLVRSRDGGQTWEVMADWLPAGTHVPLPYAHADYHALAFSRAGSKALFAGTDGGLFRLDAVTAAPAAATMSDALNVGVTSHLAYHLACAPESWPASLQGFVLGGLQDNGTRLRSLNASVAPSTFDQVYGGDGVGVAVSRAASGSGPLVALASTPGHLERSTGGGAIGTWSDFHAGITDGALPFFVRLASDDAPQSDGQTFLTFTKPPPAGDSSVYRSSGGNNWVNVSGTVHYPDGTSSGNFTDLGPKAARQDFHFLGTHPGQAGVWAVDGVGGIVYVTPDAGANWYASNVLGTNPSQALGIKGTAGIGFDPSDTSGNKLWVGSQAITIFDTTDATVAPRPVPDSYGHLFKTSDRGVSWSPVTGGGTLPNVPVVAVKFDPGDSTGATVYVGTDVGLYVTTDGGASFSRAPGLPLVRVTDICVSPASRNMKIATFGRGFWQLNTGAGGAPAGARGRGDLNFDQRLDAFDLIDLAAVLGTTNQSRNYRPEADLVGDVNAIDDSDLAAFLARFGGAP